MKVRYLVYTVIILGVGALVYYRIAENKKQKEAMQGGGKGGPQQAMAVSGIVVQAQPFSNVLQLSGSIEANEQVQISSEVQGIADKIYFTEGATVKEGQVLVHINDVELRAQAVGAKTRQDLAAENERRAKLLLQKEAISQEEYDIASADYKSALAQTQLINAQIAKASIRAPFSGVIGLRNISPGTYVTPTTLITTLVNSSKVKITFSVPEKYAAQVKNNSKIKFTVAGDETEYTATVYALEPAVDVTTRTLRVRAMADNAKGNLIPGTFANVKLQLGKVEDAFLVPTEAEVPVQDGKTVYITENGKAKQVKILAGTRTNASIQVIDGLKPGDTVLTTGVLMLKNDMPVKVTVNPNKITHEP